MVRISKKIIICCLFFLFLLSCSEPRYRDVSKDNYRSLDGFLNDYITYGDIQYDGKYNKKTTVSSSYDYKKLKNYTGYYKVGTPYKIDGKKYYPKEDKNYKEIGIASWYGEDFHNKKTANGETYNMNDFTCAHRTLPLPSLVKVTNLENGKNIVVRVNDRGPFAKNRIIDVSKNVAKKLDFYQRGTTKVKVEFLEKETNEMLKYLGLK